MAPSRPTKPPRFKKSKRGWGNVFVYDLGCRFRSKFEWYTAKRLEKAHIKWNFEVRIPLQGSFCLPDFHLPDYKIFLELRPKKRLDEKLFTKVRLLKKTYGGYEVIVITDLSGVETFIKRLLQIKEAPSSRLNEVWIFEGQRGSIIENNKKSQGKFSNANSPKYPLAAVSYARAATS